MKIGLKAEQYFQGNGIFYIAYRNDNLSIE